MTKPPPPSDHGELTRIEREVDVILHRRPLNSERLKAISPAVGLGVLIGVCYSAWVQGWSNAYAYKNICAILSPGVTMMSTILLSFVFSFIWSVGGILMHIISFGFESIVIAIFGNDTSAGKSAKERQLQHLKSVRKIIDTITIG